ncbi:FAD-binding oxidoreductase [Ruminococcaceae bacterium OttesenSCG-928-I18]|nr:FAD-binding oxidoreductase [Ruminococcaceae bacterium OttesenSCG-928-I18]
MPYDKIIIGAGLYGLYAARFCGRNGQRVLVLEKEAAPFLRATTINQARLHMGYHYPRSLSTAKRSSDYFERFVDEFKDCVCMDFEQVYATSSTFSWTDAGAFCQFCEAAGIPCEEMPVGRYFRPGMCDGAFLTREYAYDAALLRRKMMEDLAALPGVQLRFEEEVTGIEEDGGDYRVSTSKGQCEKAPFLLNASYASVNQVGDLLGFAPFSVKYELCELILCEVGLPLRKLGITVMDGPFFSIMPFGKTGLHSLTSVTFTPHLASHEPLPVFPCQERTGGVCNPHQLANCNDCPAKPESAWPMMDQLARKYLREEFGFQYRGSMFSMKPILTASEVDDSRPTLVRTLHDRPRFVSVLSGKINTVYDLEEVLL